MRAMHVYKVATGILVCLVLPTLNHSLIEGRSGLHRLVVDAPKTASGCGIRVSKTRFTRSLLRSPPRFLVRGGRDAELPSFTSGGIHYSSKHPWPWMVLLGRKRGNRNDFFCGGAIINERYVITAAHCILSVEPIFARFGEYDYRNSSIAREDIDVEDFIFHPKYDLRKGYHDIALLRLAKKITFRDEAKPICLPWGRLTNEDLAGETVTVAGWGKLAFNALSSPVLQEVNVTVFHPSTCSKSYQSLSDYAETFPEGMTHQNMLCAGHIEGGKDSCDGDSGGPVMHYEENERKYTLGGIISKGYGCGKKDYPGLNSPIRNHETLQWIKRVAF